MTLPQKERLVAFAGSGKATPANVRALLDNWLTLGKQGDEPVYAEIRDFYVPDKIMQRKQPGLSNVVGYLTEFWGDEGEDAFQTAPLSKFIDILGEDPNGTEAVLIIIAGDDGADDETADLVEAAFEAGIPVLDLAAGLDNVTADEAPTSEEPPDEPESHAEARGRRRRVVTPPDATEAPGAAEDTSAPRAKRRGTPRTKAENETRATATLDDLTEGRVRSEKIGADIVSNFGKDVPFEPPYTSGEQDTTNAVNDVFDRAVVSDEIRHLLVTALRGALAALEAPADGQLPQAEVGPTTAYIEDEDGNLRKRGRGKPKTGEEVIYLTPAEEKKRGLK